MMRANTKTCRKCTFPNSPRPHGASCRLVARNSAVVEPPAPRWLRDIRLDVFAGIDAAIAATEAPGAAARLFAEVSATEARHKHNVDTARQAARLRLGASASAKTRAVHEWNAVAVLELRGLRCDHGSVFDSPSRCALAVEAWALLYALGESKAPSWLSLSAAEKSRCLAVMCPSECGFGQCGNSRHVIVVFVTAAMTGLSAERQVESARRVYDTSCALPHEYPNFPFAACMTALHSGVGRFWL